MAKWTSSKRRDWDENKQCTKRLIVHLEGKERGICECWEEGDAERISDALNVIDQINWAASALKTTQSDVVSEIITSVCSSSQDSILPKPWTPSDAIDRLRTAGGILASISKDLFDDHGDVSMEKLLQFSNAIKYWDIVVEETNQHQPQGEPSNG